MSRYSINDYGFPNIPGLVHEQLFGEITALKTRLAAVESAFGLTQNLAQAAYDLALNGGTPPTLGPLTLTPGAFTEDTAFVSTIGGRAIGSTITAVSDDGTALTVDGNSLSGTFANPGTFNITLTEAYVGLTPYTTILPAVVSAAAPGTPTLGTLSLSTALTSGTSISGTILGATAGSSLVLTPAVTGLSINSAARTFNFDGTGTAGTSVSITETLAGAIGSPKANAVGTIAAAGTTLNALSLSGALTNGTTSTGTITGATSGSSIASNVTGLTVNSGARTYSFDGSAIAGTTANGLVETLAGATNSPRSTPVTVAAAGGGDTFVLQSNMNALGDSQTQGVGDAANQNWRAQTKSLETTPSAFNITIDTPSPSTAGGAPTSQVVGFWNAMNAGQKALPQIWAHGLSDIIYDTTYVDGAAVIKQGFADMLATYTGPFWCYAVQPAPEKSGPGMFYHADLRFHIRDMQATYGEDKVIWLDREMREAGDQTTGGADAVSVATGSPIPITFRGSNQGSPQYGFTKNNAAPITYATLAAAEADAASTADGQIAWLTDLKIWAVRSNAAFAVTGKYYSPSGSDTRHRSRYGYAADAAVHTARLKGQYGVAPFASATERRVAQDVAPGATVASVKTAGTVSSVAITAGNAGGQFAVAPSAGGFVITRTGVGTLTEGVTTLRVRSVGPNNVPHISIVDVYVGQPSTQTVPRLLNVASPGLGITGRKASGLTDGKIVSGAMWLSTTRATVQTFIYGNTGDSTNKGTFYIQTAVSGQITMVGTNAAGTQILFWRSNSGAIPASANFWLAFKVNLATGVVQIVVNNGSADTLLPANGTPVLTNDTLLFSRMIFTLLSADPPRGMFAGTNNVFGKFGLGFVATGDIDWSVPSNCRQLWNLDGTPVARAFKSPIAGVTPVVECWGGIGDLMWGSQQAMDAQPMIASYNAQAVLSL